MARRQGVSIRLVFITAALIILAFPASGASSNFIIQNATSDPLFVINATTSNVGIGLFNPQYTLDIAGDANVNNNDIRGVNELTNFFATSCASGEAIQQVFDNGSYVCANVTTEVQDRWLDETGDTFRGSFDANNFTISNLAAISVNVPLADGNISNTLTLSSGSSINADALTSGTVSTDRYSAYQDLLAEGYFNNDADSDLLNRSELDARFILEGQVAGGDLTGTYPNPQLGTDTVGFSELQDNSVNSSNIVAGAITNTELDNTADFTVGSLTSTGNIQVRGDLDVWGNITNTDVQNLNVNGSLLPPAQYNGTFDIGSSARRWRDLYLSNVATLGGGLTVESGAVTLPANSISNTELVNEEVTVNADGVLSGGGTVALGDSISISLADIYLNESGDTLAGNLSFADTYFITNLRDPVNAQDAATKAYVDTNDDVADADADPTNELQDLQYGILVSPPSASFVNQEIGISDGANITFRDYYNPNQSISYNPGTDEITLDGNGGTIDITEVNTDDQNLSEVLVQGNVANTSINVNGNNLTAVANIETGGQTVTIRDSSNDQDIARFNEGGNVEVPNGNVSLNNNSLQDTKTVDFGNGNVLTRSGDDLCLGDECL